MSNSAVILKAKNIIQFKNEEWLKLYTFNAGGMGLISGWETKLPRVVWYGQKSFKKWILDHTAGEKNALGAGPIVISLGPQLAGMNLSTKYQRWGARKGRQVVTLLLVILSAPQFSTVTQSCPTLCDPMNHSTPGLPIHHQLPEFTQTHVHRVSDAIQPSHPGSSLSPPAPNPSQHQSLFQWVNSSHEVAKVLEFQL